MSNNINYIGKIDAEWVDPKVELPPDGWNGMAMFYGSMPAHSFYSDNGWFDYDDEEFTPPIAWLRIGGPSTAIPRAKVQAAVDEMRHKADSAAEGTQQEIAAIGIRGSIGCIAHHTGVTPTEVE